MTTDTTVGIQKAELCRLVVNAFRETARNSLR
jgi:hypothetical protein